MRRFAVIAVLFLVPLAVHAQTPPPAPAPDPTANRHLGFFLRMDTGVAYTATKATMPEMTWDGITSVSIPFGIAVGGAVLENFIVAGEFWGVTALAPSSPVGRNYSNITLGGIGMNLTYYFMPVNIYVSATPSLSLVVFKQDGASFATLPGFGAKVAVGKEWWVADHWGIGVALQFFLGLNADQATASGATWTTLGGAVAFSATYN